MVKNKGGKKTKSKSRKGFRQKELNIKDLKKIDDQEYAHVLFEKGDGRYDLICYDKVRRMGILRGTLRRKHRVTKGDLVLISIREFQNDKCDIVGIYTQNDVNRLMKEGEVTKNFVKSGAHTNVIGDDVDYISPNNDDGDKSGDDPGQASDDDAGLNIGDI